MATVIRRHGIAAMIGLLALMGWGGWADGQSVSTGGTILQPSGVVIFNAFDPSLGTLTAVRFSLTGSVVVDVATPVYTPAGSGEPEGYSFTQEVGEQFHGPMSLVPGTQYLLSGQATAGSPSTSIQIDYQYSTEIDSQTDLQGGIAPLSVEATTSGTVIPAGFVSAKLSNFVGVPHADVQFEFTDLFSAGESSSTSDEPVSFDGVSGGGAVSIEYDYTAPEPGSIARLMVVLLGLARPSRIARGGRARRMDQRGR
jgi:hypothetical protein